ncbi:MAG: glycosyltransferase family 2 protein [Bacteroidaceae bacterium]|nr:glycosyltransferase family 2 protein [Bacteroidaceae bacterium]
MSLTINILISTIGERIKRVPDVIMPQREGVSYIVSHQTDGSHHISKSLTTRPDVTLSTIAGRGLCANRNNAIEHATADICIIADDDCRYDDQFLENIKDAYSKYPEADIICFTAQDYNSRPLHRYPAEDMPYLQAVARGYYPTSIQTTFRLQSIEGRTAFNINFGLGSDMLCAGEEEVFMADALRAGLNIMYVNKPIVRSDPDTTGTHFLTDKQLQITKGATFRHCYGYANAVWRSVREAGWWFVHRGANPFPILCRMLKGIRLNY